MWKRMGRRAEDKQIGNPVLLETTYDEDQLRHIPTVSDAQNAAYQAESFSPSTQTYSYNIYSPRDPRDFRPAETHSVSPPYAPSSPPQRLDYSKGRAAYPTTADISPPSSPEPDDEQRDPRKPRRFRSMRDVSPLDESRGQPQQPTVVPSHIPVLRRVRDSTPPRASTQKFWPGRVAPDGKVRWDEYSGEPTSGNTGKTGQVDPLAFAKDASVPLRSHPVTARDTIPATQTNATRKMAPASDRPGHSGAKPSPLDTPFTPREPWKGASGRVEIVQPFRDQPAKQPLNFQRKPEPKAVRENARSASSAVASPTDRVPAAADTRPVAGAPQALDTHDDPIKPVVPLKVGRNSPPRSIASPGTPHHPVIPSLASPASLEPASSGAHADPNPRPTVDNRPVAPKAEERKPTERQVAERPTTPTTQKVATQPVEPAPGDHGPSSRFSWTTYNTTTTYQHSQHSPPPSPPPPLPTATPALNQEPIPAAASILNRRRAVPPTSEKVTARKPLSSTTPSAGPQPTTMRTTDPPSPRPASAFSTNTQKALPRPPTELTAADHVDILEAQMEDLRIRRSNVHRLLQDLNNQAPPNPLITDFKKARMVERRKKEFEEELAEIRAEEHGVGLRLHRALRRREREDPGAGSAIWVRRVTR